MSYIKYFHVSHNSKHDDPLLEEYGLDEDDVPAHQIWEAQFMGRVAQKLGVTVEELYRNFGYAKRVGVVIDKEAIEKHKKLYEKFGHIKL